VRRVVLDTMVLASGFTSAAGASARLLERWRAGEFLLVGSEHILEELKRTLLEAPYFAARTTHSVVETIVASQRRRAHLTPLTVPVVGVATQPKDDLVLSTALSGRATILCTRDKQLLKLRTYETFEVLSPGELLAVLEADAIEPTAR
jgi:putative PIN family toxin of toxin-antitoxin system